MSLSSIQTRLLSIKNVASRADEEIIGWRRMGYDPVKPHLLRGMLDSVREMQVDLSDCAKILEVLIADHDRAKR